MVNVSIGSEVSDLDKLTRAGVHHIDLARWKGGWPADQRAPGKTSWSASGHGYVGPVARRTHVYFGTGRGATYEAALSDLLRIVTAEQGR